MVSGSENDIEHIKRINANAKKILIFFNKNRPNKKGAINAPLVLTKQIVISYR